MNDCLINSQNILPFSSIITLVIIGISYLALRIGHKREASNSIPKWWEKITFSILVLLIAGTVILVKKCTTNEVVKSNYYLTKEKTIKILEIDGALVIELMMNEVIPKLEELEGIPVSKIDINKDLILLKGRLLEIIETTRVKINELDERLPNGVSLADAMKEEYKQDEFEDDFSKITSELFKEEISTSEKINSIESFIKRKQYKLAERIIRKYFLSP